MHASLELTAPRLHLLTRTYVRVLRRYPNAILNQRKRGSLVGRDNSAKTNEFGDHPIRANAPDSNWKSGTGTAQWERFTLLE